MTADDLETDVCCFFVIVAGRADGGNDFSNTLWSAQAKEPAGRIIFANTTTPKEEKLIMLFDSRTVYLGASRDKYEQYCKALDSEKIKYKTKRVNHEEKMIAPGRGTARSMGGNFGTDKTLYEILVGEKAYDNAMGILTALK